MGQIADALGESLAKSRIPDGSAATVALLRKYARLLDAAAPNAKYRRAITLLAKVVDHYQMTMRLSPLDERALEDMSNTIIVALGEHSVASDIGPKFLAALGALGLSIPAAASPGAGAGVTSGSADDELARLRQERRDREHRA